MSAPTESDKGDSPESSAHWIKLGLSPIVAAIQAAFISLMRRGILKPSRTYVIRPDGSTGSKPDCG